MLPYVVVVFFFLQHPPFSTSASGGPPIISIVSLFPLPCLVFHRATFDVDAPIVKSESLLAFFARVSDSLSSRSLSFVHDASTPYIYIPGGHLNRTFSRAHHHPKRACCIASYLASTKGAARAFLILSLFLSVRARATPGGFRSVDRPLSLSLFGDFGQEVPEEPAVQNFRV